MRATDIGQTVSGRIAIFIDAANLEMSMKSMTITSVASKDGVKLRVSYRRLLQFFQSIHSVSQARFYSARFNTDTHDAFLTVIKKSGFKLVTKPLKEYRDHTVTNPHRKANFDVEIATDAIRLQQTFDTFVLFSGDCDFEYLIKVLQTLGKKCIVFSRAGHISRELISVTPYYFDVVDFRDQFLML